MRRKVCILTSAYYVFDGKIFHRHARSLVKAGYDVILIAQHDRDEIIDGVRIVALPKHKNRFQRITSTTLRSLLVAMRQKADVYHLHNPELLPVGVLLKLFTRGRIISDIHEDYPRHIMLKDWIPSHLRRISSLLLERLEMVTAKYFDAVTTPTDPLTDRFRCAKRKVTLYNFPLLGLFKSPGERIAGPNLEFDIIHIGSISQPRLSFMFDVGLELKRGGYDFKWCLLGTPPEIIRWSGSILDRYGLKDNFVLLGQVPHTEVVGYLNRSKVGINHHPPQQRFLVAIPIKLFEYMACSLPVVSSDLPLVRRFVKDQDCAILVRPDDVGEFAAAIGFLLDNPEKARSMGSRGRYLVENVYNWACEERKLLGLYSSVINR